MKKKLIILIFTVTALFSFNACGPFPSFLEIRAAPDISLPIGRDNGNLSDTLVGFIFKALDSAKTGGADVKVLTYKDFKIGAKDVQTFIVQYNVMGDDTLNFADKLSDFNNMINDFENFELDLSEFENIELGDMTSIGKDQDKLVDVDISGILADTASSFQADISGQIDLKERLIIGLGVNFNQEISYSFTIENLDAVTFKTGTLSVGFEILGRAPWNNVNGADFTFKAIEIRDGVNPPIPGYSGGTREIHFSNTSASHTVEFDLAERTLQSEFEIVLDGFEDITPHNYAKDVDLKIGSPSISDTHVKGVDRYVIQTGKGITSDVNDYDITIGFDDSFIHAEIGSGVIKFDIEAPPNDGTPDKSWIVLHDGVDLVINILQENKIDYGELRLGLNDGSGGFLVCDEEENDISGKHINLNTIQVKDSTVTLSEGTKVSFMLSEADFGRGKVGVDFVPSIIVDNFSVLHMKDDVLTSAHPNIESISLGEAAEYLKSIDFNDVGIVLQFGKVDVEGLEIMIYEPNLKINTGKLSYEITGEDENGIPQSIGFWNSESKPFTLDIAAGVITELNFEVEIKNTHNSNGVLELHNIDVSQGNIKFEIIEYDVVFDWEKAVVDFSQMNQDSSFPIDGLSAIKEYINGFEFNKIESYLYIDAPDSFFNMEPKPDISLSVVYSDPTKIPPSLYEGGEFPFVKKTVPYLGEGNEYSGTIDPGTEVNFAAILNDLPDGQIEIKYNVNLAEMTIFPETLEDLTNNSESSAVRVAVIVILPMSLKAKSGGATFSIPNMFEGKDDIFDRSGGDDFSFLSLIKKLNLSIGLSDEVFTGGLLFMRRENETPENANLRFNLSGKNMKVPIDGEMLEKINTDIPYDIVEMGIRFAEGTTLIIPSNLGVINIAFDAEFVYEIGF
ncbi:MAG: hypothetical protein FWB73_01285 [Treponema sp.]|nr:hypothetical protein [Treponema sp.]